MLTLTYQQKRDFHEQGFLHLPGLVSQPMVDEALRRINHHLGAHGMHPDELVTMRAQTYCRDIRTSDAIVGLLTQTPAHALAASLVGGVEQLPQPTSGQIALRFPSPEPTDQPRRKAGLHLDGMYSPHNGVTKGDIHSFTMLASVALSATPHPYCGNFTVSPGSHHIYEAYFQEHRPDALLHGMPDVEIAPPVQLITQPGDVVLVHYQVAHSAAPNHSPHVRYACFYRLSVADHADHKREAMTDIWREWPAIRDVIAADDATAESAETSVKTITTRT